MAFVPMDDARSSNQNANTGKQQQEKKTPIAYLNLYMPLRNGHRIKVCPSSYNTLYAENSDDVALVELIKSGKVTPEQLASRIIVEMSLARDKNEPLDFDLGIEI